MSADEINPEQYRRHLTVRIVELQVELERTQRELKLFNSRRQREHRTKYPFCVLCLSGEHDDNFEH